MTLKAEPKKELADPKKLLTAKKKTKRSVNWRNDPEILARLAAVSEMMLVRAKTFQIAAAFDVSMSTAKRDIARVKQLWGETSRETVEEARTQSIEQYRLVLMRAWEKYGKSGEQSKADRYLQIVMQAQARIDKVSGVEIERAELTGKDGGPISIQDIEAQRNKRWKQVTTALAEIDNEDEHEDPLTGGGSA